jgi:hypothetical protein
MRILRAAAIIALLAGPVYAQSPDQHVPRYGETSDTKRPQEIENDKQADKAYNKSLGNIPDKGPVDPWGIARSADAPKEAGKAAAKTATKSAPAKSGTKTGSAANSKAGSAAN